MRMWNVDPKRLCNRHLCGEHVEMHMFAGTLMKGKSIQGYVNKGLVESQRIKERHNELAVEMVRRGMNHKSPLNFYTTLQVGSVDVKESLIELTKRCSACADLILKDRDWENGF